MMEDAVWGLLRGDGTNSFASFCIEASSRPFVPVAACNGMPLQIQALDGVLWLALAVDDKVAC